MSVAKSNALRSLRIIAIPLTKPKLRLPKSSTSQDTAEASTSGSKPQSLTYYQFQINHPKPVLPPRVDSTSGKKSWLPKEGVVNWVQNKAATTWNGFGKAPKGTWKFKVHQYGERIVDRIDFEELALKSVDPSLGPTITHPDIRGSEMDASIEEKPEAGSKLMIPLLYPSTITSAPAALAHLRTVLAHRTPRHRKGFYTWMIISPFTAPFMIIPIIPNLPFFFCVWRSWSHYKAYRASQYLEKLVERGVIVPKASRDLELVYEKYDGTKKSTPTETETGAKPQSSALLSSAAVLAILSTFQLKEGVGADLSRAFEQAKARIVKGDI